MAGFDIFRSLISFFLFLIFIPFSFRYYRVGDDNRCPAQAIWINFKEPRFGFESGHVRGHQFLSSQDNHPVSSLFQHAQIKQSGRDILRTNASDFAEFADGELSISDLM